MISVLMAVNKTDEFLNEAISSILLQSFTDFEFVIVCNGPFCDDVHAHIEQNYSDSRIRLFRSRISGLANALNFGLNYCSFEYVARMDADDISHMNRFEVQLKFLETNPEYGVVGCKVQLIDESTITLPDPFYFCPDNRGIKAKLPYLNTLCHPALMFRKKALLDVGCYRYGYHSEDHDLFIRISDETEWKFANVSLLLFSYRRHSGQLTSGKQAWRISREVSVILLLHFLRSGNPKYLMGIILVSLPLLMIKKFVRKTIRRLRL
jgi:O86/O127-antigen biosynthesis beta-1,3-galactosyltransferase